jgi:methionine-rich copper-binding protein CopC
LAVRLAVSIGAAATVTVAAAGPSQAHAHLVKMTPASGSTVSALPGEVALTFDDVISPELATIVVRAPDGTDVAAGPAHVNGDVVDVALKPSTKTGRFLVSYRVISDDGHPVSDQLAFTVAGGGPATGAQPAAAAASATLDGPVGEDSPTNWWVAHAIHLVLGAAVVGVGALLMVVLSRPPKPRAGKA